MIPKIIHYCWLSSEPYPELVQRCMASWSKYLKDYELVLWNFDRFPKGKNIWVDEAYNYHKYAFAADYIRLYALYNYGGIYLDTDVEILKSFDSLLQLPYFIGKEQSGSGIEAAIIGAEAGTLWLKDCLDYYENRHFKLGFGLFSRKALPSILRERIEQKRQLKFVSSINSFILDDKFVCIFPIDWFSPKSFLTGEIKTTQDTIAIHHFVGAWAKNRLDEKIRAQLSKYKKILLHLLGQR